MKKLKLSTENEDISIFPNYLFGIMLTSNIEKVLGIKYPKMFCEYKKTSNKWANDLEVANENAKILISKIQNNSRTAQNCRVA